MNREVEAYLKLISKKLTIPRKEKAALLASLQDRTESFAEEREDVTRDMLLEEFGSAEELMKAWADTQDPKKLSKELSQNRKTVKIVLIIAAAVVVIAAILIAAYFIYGEPVIDGYFIETISQDEAPSLPPPISTDTF